MGKVRVAYGPRALTKTHTPSVNQAKDDFFFFSPALNVSEKKKISACAGAYLRESIVPWTPPPLLTLLFSKKEQN